MFKPLINLQNLYLNENQLRSIDRNSFPQLEHLLVLSLTDNQIGHIEPGSFDFPNLQHLYLSRNLLMNLEDDTFKGVEHLMGL